MKPVVLIYDDGDEWEKNIKIERFANQKDMIQFVNKNSIGYSVEACFEIREEIEIEAFERVTEYRVKEKGLG